MDQNKNGDGFPDPISCINYLSTGGGEGEIQLFDKWDIYSAVKLKFRDDASEAR